MSHLEMHILFCFLDTNSGICHLSEQYPRQCLNTLAKCAYIHFRIHVLMIHCMSSDITFDCFRS